jgi:hypothetical protein
MKTDRERKEIIEAINVLLHQAYDSTLDEILALLRKIDEEEDKEDLKDIQEAREDIRINGTVSWEEYRSEEEYKRESA